MNHEKYDLVIIGAGICGLTIGKLLTNSSVNFKIFEKSRAFGGRASTRRVNGQPIDHGAQYFTVTDLSFREFINEYIELGIVKLWSNKLNIWDGKSLMYESQTNPRYICPDGFTALSKEIAKVIPVSREVRITKANFNNKKWELLTDQNLEIEAEKVISTAPINQSLEIFSNYLREEELMQLQSVNFDPCISVILVYELANYIPWKGVFWNSGDTLSWVANDSSKRTNPTQTVIVAQCKPDFSRLNFKSEDEHVTNLVINELKQILPTWVQSPQETQVKRWKYSKANSTLDKPFFESENKKLIFTGDWCLESKIESAFLCAEILYPN
ncbi:MAG: FAD-dependent oxidoreductase [Candidatus Caenarcaniphilales bacterium]|nr:FAD-dependent oxidoreductase [Candidatus Caenarcaniphilales bacterium]